MKKIFCAIIIFAYFTNSFSFSQKPNGKEMALYTLAGAFYGGGMGGTIQLLSVGTYCRSYEKAFVSHAISGAFVVAFIYSLVWEDSKRRDSIR
jgi:hypothetical protein